MAGLLYYSEGNSGACSWWSTSTTSKPERVVVFSLVIFFGKKTSRRKEDKPRCWCCKNYGGGLMMDGRLCLKNIKIFLRCSDVWRLVTRQSPVSMFMSPSDFAHKHDAQVIICIEFDQCCQANLFFRPKELSSPITHMKDIQNTRNDAREVKRCPGFH